MRVPICSLASAAAVLCAASVIASPGDTPNRGLLGTALYPTAIHSRPSGYSALCCRIPKDMRLVVFPYQSATWIRVLLNTGAVGYVPKDAVQVYPYVYSVTRTAPSRRTMPLASRGGNRTAALAADPVRAEVADNSKNFIGKTPYKWGGNDIVNGIDCSGFVKKLYGEVGLNLPRTAAEQAQVGQRITRLENLREGDRLYFWEAKRGMIGHTGIYVGNGYFVHSSSGHHGVERDFLGQPKWLRILVDARR